REFETRFPLQIRLGKARGRIRAFPFSHQALAGWQSGHAAACKAVYAGSIPTSASRLFIGNTVAAARVVKLVDTRDLKSLGASHAGSIPAPGTSRTSHGSSTAFGTSSEDQTGEPNDKHRERRRLWQARGSQRVACESRGFPTVTPRRSRACQTSPRPCPWPPESEVVSEVRQLGVLVDDLKQE